MTISDKAISYGDARYGRSCQNCNLSVIHLARGLLCGLYDLPTNSAKCCGTWCGEKIEPETEQAEQGKRWHTTINKSKVAT